MSLINLFTNYFKPVGEKKITDRKLSVKQTLLEPALDIFTKNSSSSDKKASMCRLTDLEKLQLIKDRSVLQKITPEAAVAKSGIHMNALLGQIHADALISKTELEELSSHQGVKAWLDLLQKTKEVQIPRPLLDSLEQYEKTCQQTNQAVGKPLEVHQLALRTAQAVHDLKRDASYLVEGGRRQGGVDCPILFEFIRTADNTYDLYVYLAGKKQVRESFTENSRKTWLRPIVYYKDIPADTHLFFGKDKQELKTDFFQSLLETRCLSDIYEGKYVTLHQLGHLQAYRQDLPSTIAARRANSDAWSSIKPFIIRRLGKDAYKKAILEIKLNSLVEGYQAAAGWIQEDNIKAERLRIVLKRGAQLMLKQLASRSTSRLAISEDFYLKARATALDLIDQLGLIEKKTAQDRILKAHDFHLEKINKEECGKKYLETLQAAKKEIKQAEKNAGSIESTRARLVSLPAPENFAQEASLYTRAYESDVRVAGIRAAEIEHLVSQMKVPNKEGHVYWDNIPPGEIPSVLTSLDTMVSIYAQSISEKKEGITARESNTAFTLYAVIHYLALKQDVTVLPEGSSPAASLAHYAAYFPGMAADNDAYLLFTSREDYERRDALIAYFKETYLKASRSNGEPVSLFNFSTSHHFTSYRPSKQEGLGRYLYELAHVECFSDVISSSRLIEKADINPIAVLLTPNTVKKGWLASQLANHLNPMAQDGNGQNILSAHGFAHVPILARAAHAAHLFAHMPVKLIENGGHEFRSYAHFSLEDVTLGIPRNFSLSIHGDYQNRYGFTDLLHPVLRKDQKELLQKRWIKRDKAQDTTLQEAEVLSEVKNTNEKITEEISLLRASCEPSLFPHKLVAYYRSKLHLIESFEEQELFELAFFRSVALEGDSESEDIKFYDLYEWKSYCRRRYFPVAEELAQKGFQQQVKLFIQEGLDRYFLRQPNQRPKVLPATFFLRLACRLSRFLDGSPLIDSIDYLEKMLKIEDLSTEEKCLLSLHTVLAYSTLPRDLTQAEIEQVFSAWVYYKNTPLPEGWRNPMLEKEATTFVHACSAFLENSKDPSFHRSILKTALGQMGIELPDSFSVNAQEPHLIHSRGHGGFWEINLLTGEVRCPDGILCRTKAPQGLQNGIFTYLFGAINPSYLQSKGCYYFSHPKLGTLRAVKVGHFGTEFAIQRQFDGEWYQYVAPNRLQNLPYAICAAHTHWIHVDTYSSTLKICDRASGQTVMEIDGTHIKDLKNEGFIWNVPANTFLNQFERPQYIYRLEIKNKKFLVFPRYTSQSHQPLMFEEEGADLVFAENRKYLLSQKQYPGLLGAKNGSLVLVHRETGAYKVLVPLRPLIQHGRLSTQHEIDVSDIQIKNDELGELYTNQKQRFEFLEFDVKQGSLQPLTQEGNVYLAYQCLAQRRYAEAFHWIRTLDYRDRLSAQSQIYLARLIEIANRTDRSPEASAIGLHAWVMMTKAARRATIEKRPFAPVPNAHKIRAVYSRFEHQISENFLLTTEEQALCGIKRQGDMQRAYYPEMQKYVTYPSRDLQKIESVELANETFGFEMTAAIRKQDYYAEHYVQANRERVKQATYFIPWDPVPSNYDAPHMLSAAWSEAFEQGFFSRAYEIAKRGSELEKRLLSLKLHALAAAHRHSGLPESWKLLQLALRYPAAAPELPDPKSFQARYDFINQCASLSASLGRSDMTVGEPQLTFELNPGDAPLRPILPFSPAPKKVQVPQNPLKLLPFDFSRVDAGFTLGIFNGFFVEKTKKVSPTIPFPDHVKEETLAPEEKDFFQILQAEFKEFAEDYQKGKEINGNRKFYHLKDAKALQSELENEIKNLDEELADLEVSILELANKHDLDDRKKTLYKESKIEQELSLKHLADLFLQGDADRFAAANPYLREGALISKIAKAYGLKEDPNVVIEYLYNKIGLYMTIHVQKNKLQRAVKLCKEIVPLGEKDLKKGTLIQKLADELKPLEKTVYSISDYPAFLVFEYLSGLSIRANQADLLKKLLKEDVDGRYLYRVIQLIMGGGKTSVMAVVLLRLAAKKSRLSLFVTPASQYASVSHNLRKTLRECFGMDMEEIDVTREQLAKSTEMCEEILHRFKSTIYAGNFLLVKAETLQTIGLEFLDLVYQAANSEVMDEELLKKINLLKEVLLTLRRQGDALFDEVDLLLNVLQEVNFPVGEEEKISPERIEVIRALFTLFVSEQVEIDGSHRQFNLKELISLRANRQNLLSQEIWKMTVARAVAWNLPRTLASLKLKDKLHFCDSFYRYISGTMSVRCQMLLDDPKQVFELTEEEQIDFEFLTYVRALHLAKNNEEQEASHHIALIKHMMQSVLPVTFGKNGKRHYGRGGTHPGEVRPYLAVDTPSENLFGYHWEAIAYHFQTALQCGISREQMLQIAQVYKEQAEIRSDRENIVFDATFEAIEFKDLTGVALHELERSEKVDEAIKNLNNNLEALLRFEADTAGEYVTFYPNRLTSTGQTLVNILSTVRAMSGTPYNTPCYPKKLAKNFEPAVGTEGQIAEAALGRAAAKQSDKTYAHILKSDNMDDILKELLDKHPQKDKVRLLLDSGALFKDFSNVEVAKKIRDYLKIPVLFFMRNPRTGEKTPDTLALLKVGSDHPIIIGGTRLEDIQKTGYNIDDYFFFGDERHTTGTDIPLIPDAIGLMTLDETMLRRTFFQTILRERDYFLDQDIEYVIPYYLLKILEKNGTTLNSKNEDLERIFSHLLVTIKNQAIAKSKHYYRSCKQKIDEIFKENLFIDLLIDIPLTYEHIKKNFPAYQGNVLVRQGDQPYNRFGAIEYPIDSMVALNAYAERKLKQFPDSHPKKRLIESQIQAILKAAKKSPYRPRTVLEAASQDLGIQVDILTEVAEEVEHQVEQEVEQELLQELQLYQTMRPSPLRQEEDWNEEKMIEFISALQQDKNPGQPLRTLPFLLGNKSIGYKRDFTPVFSKSIRVTDSWALAMETPLPVFHKMQRPLDQILIIKSPKGYQAVGLSQKEARQFKAFLASGQASDLLKKVWLIQADGSHLQDTPAGPLPIKDDEIQKILFECNVFNGRIDYLDAHAELASEWLHVKEGAYIKIKKDFLKLRVAQNPVQKKLFFKSEVFGDSQAQGAQRKYRWQMMAEKMASYDQAKIQSLTDQDKNLLKWLNADQLNMITPDQVAWLADHQIPYLNKPDLIHRIPKKFAFKMRTEQMGKLAPAQVQWFEESIVYTQAMPVAYCPHMSDGQIKLLSPNQVMEITDKDQIKRIARLNPKLLAHITGEQVKAGLIEEENVPHLRKREAIEALPTAWQEKAPQVLRRQTTPELSPDEASKSASSIQPASKKKKESSKNQQMSITCIVLVVLGSLVAIGLLVAGAFAILGACWAQAPQFMVTIYHGFQAPLLMPITFASGGTILLVSLISYAIHHCCQRRHRPNRPATV